MCLVVEEKNSSISKAESDNGVECRGIETRKEHALEDCYGNHLVQGSKGLKHTF